MTTSTTIHEPACLAGMLEDDEGARHACTCPPEAWRLSSDTDGWSASHDGMGSSEYRAVKNAAGTVVALVVAQSEDHWADLDTETPGRLIAAVPELLEAAQALLTAWNTLLPKNKLFKVGAADDLEDLEFREVSALRAAIAKATGQSPAPAHD